jgi:hypothetical protein
MLEKLTRILLALVTAFVFTGQMEAAAEHCARLAEQAATLEPSPASDCHETQKAVAVVHHGAASNHVSLGDMTHHTGKTSPDAPDSCECIAALKLCMDFVGSTASARVAPYAWLVAGEGSFASSQPDPDLRPPRA